MNNPLHITSHSSLFPGAEEYICSNPNEPATTTEKSLAGSSRTRTSQHLTISNSLSTSTLPTADDLIPPAKAKAKPEPKSEAQSTCTTAALFQQHLKTYKYFKTFSLDLTDRATIHLDPTANVFQTQNTLFQSAQGSCFRFKDWELRCAQCCFDLQCTRRRPLLKKALDRAVNLRHKDTLSIGSHYHIRCSHSTPARTFFEKLGTEPCKRVENLLLEVKRDDPDVLASAVDVIGRYLLNVQEATVVFMPISSGSTGRKQDSSTSRKWAKILATLERGLPKKERLRVYGRSEDVKFMGIWMENKRQWHVYDSAEYSSGNRTPEDIY